MDIKKLKANYQIAQLRAGSDPSEANLAILEQARQEYEAALDPESEKKMEDQDLDPEPDSDQDPQIQPITNNPLKTTQSVS
ncbi:hypothetical protein DYBT9275_00899 [Dyadobacter sp. CECT 9275]|uniref:Uncharacterized protein n=1 Tax=Dyadobacter helix TaxID=2822344 RepID=A0A916J957_9BACT|nr:hypothetical protein [Dyadobacter sp. CECT 9275]CAG4992127.1 hypothetical protein DYBT9275_00899 [Dyadobacter sp. CECT 9275]